ncbi:hypothetical protein Hanom_Chr06g00525691 [Helianthus anomalus]
MDFWIGPIIDWVAGLSWAAHVGQMGGSHHRRHTNTRQKKVNNMQVVTVNYGSTVIYGGPEIGHLLTVTQFVCTVKESCPP